MDRSGHEHLAAATADTEALAGLDASLYEGWGGLVFAASALARGRPRYGRLLERAETLLVAGAHHLAQQVARARRSPPPSIDVISGLAGIVAALLVRRGRANTDAALTAVLGSLSGLAVTENGLPRAAAPGNWGKYPPHDGTAPVLNLGFAHGVPGVIAALSVAMLDGVTVPGQSQAVEDLVGLAVAVPPGRRCGSGLALRRDFCTR